MTLDKAVKNKNELSQQCAWLLSLVGQRGQQMLCSEGQGPGRNVHATQLEVLASGD